MNPRMAKRFLIVIGLCLLLGIGAFTASAWTDPETPGPQQAAEQPAQPPRAVQPSWTPLPIIQDPLVRMPGTQPGHVQLSDPTECVFCHGGYDPQVEPIHTWQGSMMSQSARDPLFWPAMVVAGQDSIFAIGRPNAVDICERCHFPKGWLEGRSDPPNASAMIGGDFDGVQCDFCHRMVDPFFEPTYAGTREGNSWQIYWDEAVNTGPGSGTLAQTMADTTRTADQAMVQSLNFFNGTPYFGPTYQPIPPNYTENAAGQYFVSPQIDKRASFSDAPEYHPRLYSRYHKSKYFCSSCHDVSNPVLANLAFEGTPPGNGTTVLPTEEQSAFAYMHVERTFSEFMLSDYGQPGGALGIGPFASDVFSTSRSSETIATCQDCHMRDRPGTGAKPIIPDVVLRTGNPATTGSTEHPYSGVPTHDLTGGNVWSPTILASAVTGSPNYDPVNAALLGQGANALTLDLTQGLGPNPVALLDGAARAGQNLLDAAAIQNLSYDTGTGALSFRIQNQTGHKLISGYPEGRRIFVTIRVLDAAQNVLYEVNPYDNTAGTLRGLPNSPNSPPLGPNEVYRDDLVYEMKTRSSLTNEPTTFHFALSDSRYKDNRIPPKGFDISGAAARLAQPVWQGQNAPNYFTAAEYAGGYDYLRLNVVPGGNRVEVVLNYQITSREYVEFLRDEINGTGHLTLPDPNPGTPTINEAYIVQTDPFFTKLKAWGDTLWQLWLHNKDLPGAAPVVMTQAVYQVAPSCNYADVQPNADHSNPALCDQDVDIADIQRIAGCWNRPISPTCPAGLDLDNSTTIDVIDIIMAAEEWGWPH